MTQEPATQPIERIEKGIFACLLFASFFAVVDTVLDIAEIRTMVAEAFSKQEEAQAEIIFRVRKIEQQVAEVAEKAKPRQ